MPKYMDIGEYRVKWVPCGWTFAEAKVYIRKGIFGIFDKLVWTGASRNISEAEKMYPDRMEEWFNRAIEEYEKYQQAWNKKRLDDTYGKNV